MTAARSVRPRPWPVRAGRADPDPGRARQPVARWAPPSGIQAVVKVVGRAWLNTWKISLTKLERETDRRKRPDSQAFVGPSRHRPARSSLISPPLSQDRNETVSPKAELASLIPRPTSALRTSAVTSSPPVHRDPQLGADQGLDWPIPCLARHSAPSVRPNTAPASRNEF